MTLRLKNCCSFLPSMTASQEYSPSSSLWMLRNTRSKPRASALCSTWTLKRKKSDELWLEAPLLYNILSFPSLNPGFLGHFQHNTAENTRVQKGNLGPCQCSTTIVKKCRLIFCRNRELFYDQRANIFCLHIVQFYEPRGF